MIALGIDGSHEVVATIASFPMCIDFHPDRPLLVVDSAQRRLLRREPDGPWSHMPLLFVVGQNFGGPEPAQPSGRVVTVPAPAPGAGKP